MVGQRGAGRNDRDADSGQLEEGASYVDCDKPVGRFERGGILSN